MKTKSGVKENSYQISWDFFFRLLRNKRSIYYSVGVSHSKISITSIANEMKIFSALLNGLYAICFRVYNIRDDFVNWVWLY